MANGKSETQKNPTPARRRKKWRIVLAVAFFAVVVSLVAPPFPLCRDMGFVCEHTASRKGYRKWFIGLRTNQWYSESRLERFMVEKHPQDLTHRWVSFMGTGKNFLGRPISFAHGNPHYTLMTFRKPFDDYVDSLDDAGKLGLFRVLASGEKEEIEVHLAAVRERPFEPFKDPHR